MKSRIFLIITVLCLSLNVWAEHLSPNAELSLLTCTPGNEVYSTFGHSALRVKDAENGMDIVFNYGLFDFNTEHFYLKFVRGETYYCLGMESYNHFVESNARIGRETYEQHLLLTPEEKDTIYMALLENYKPENRYYLYNFVFDNCATRPFVLIQNALGERLPTPELEEEATTYRELINHYSGENSWLTFGINLIFGADADKLIVGRKRPFLPEQLATYIAHTDITDSPALPIFEVAQTPWWKSKYLFYIVLALLFTVLMVVEITTKKVQWWFDSIIYFVYFVLGCIACFLSFLSIHPLVQHNWNELFLNPLMLVPFALLFIPPTRRWMLKHQLWFGLVFCILLIVRIAVSQALHPILWLPVLHIVLMLSRTHISKWLKTNKLKAAMVVFVCLIALPISAQTPKLTVLVQVEGLSYESLNEMRPYWQQGGLRTMDEDARKIEITYPFLIQGGVEATASVLTGQPPSVSGIAGDKVFHRSERKISPIYEDVSVEGIVTDKHLSPRAILSPTLSDNFRLRYGQSARIVAIGVNPNPTLTLAGHAANVAVWLDREKKQWATTTYFNEGLPNEADKMNISEQLQDILTKAWQPRLDISAYLHTTPQEKKNKFNYPVNQYLTETPFANQLVINLALEMQKKRKLGTNHTPDLLLLSLSVLTPKSASATLETAEQEDMYLAFNQDLGYLIEQLDRQVGAYNYQIILFGTPHYGISEQALNQINMQAQEFNIDRVAALLNTYLMAIYGHERWVDGSNGQSIYLNHSLLEQKKIALSTIEEQICPFLLEFSGVRAVYTYEQIASLTNQDAVLLQNTQLKQQMGDIYLMLQPLWHTNTPIFLTAPTSPLFIYTKQRTTITQETLPSTEVMKIVLDLIK